LTIDEIVLNSLIKIISERTLSRNIYIDNFLFDDFEIKLISDKDMCVRLTEPNTIESNVRFSVAAIMEPDMRLDLILKSKSTLTIVKKNMDQAIRNFSAKKKSKRGRSTKTIGTQKKNHQTIFSLGDNAEIAGYKLNKYLENHEDYLASLLGLKFGILEIDEMRIQCDDISDRMRAGFEKKLKGFLEGVTWEDYLVIPKQEIFSDTYIKDYNLKIHQHFVDIELTFE
jgi:hypothetical protein